MVFKKGVFWKIEEKYLAFMVDCDSEGIPLEEIPAVMRSKNGQNFQHKAVWQTLSKKVTGRKPFDYYPRGRVEIHGGKAIIFAHPQLVAQNLKEWAVKKFELTEENGIISVSVKADGSAHYSCHTS